jgi:hypothetical protein
LWSVMVDICGEVISVWTRCCRELVSWHMKDAHVKAMACKLTDCS